MNSIKFNCHSVRDQPKHSKYFWLIIFSSSFIFTWFIHEWRTLWIYLNIFGRIWQLDSFPRRNASDWICSCKFNFLLLASSLLATGIKFPYLSQSKFTTLAAVFESIKSLHSIVQSSRSIYNEATASNHNWLSRWCSIKKDVWIKHLCKYCTKII